MTRIAIVGGPHSGYIELADALSARLSLPAILSDDLRHLPWSDQSAVIATWMLRPAPWLLAGPAVIRGLRKRMSGPGRPVDHVIYLRPPPGQRDGSRAMSRQVATVLEAIQHQLLARGASLTVLVSTRDKQLAAREWSPGSIG